MRIATSAVKRIVNATRWVEEQTHRSGTLSVGHRGLGNQPWWGVTKERIDNKSSGDVYVVNSDPEDPTTSSTVYYTVANPYMGDLIAGMPVLVTSATVETASSGIVWHIAPFHLVYEVKLNSGITAVGEGEGAGTPGTCTIYENGSVVQNASLVDETIDCYLRWVPNTTDGTAGALARASWDMRKQRFYIDAMEC